MRPGISVGSGTSGSWLSWLIPFNEAGLEVQTGTTSCPYSEARLPDGAGLDVHEIWDGFRCKSEPGSPNGVGGHIASADGTCPPTPQPDTAVRGRKIDD
jgi:hypothetical protein